MPTFHHANLGVPPDLVEEESRFLTEILGYRLMALPAEAAAVGARWFEADDRTQIHLSVDADHQPAAKAHTAIDVSGESEAIQARLKQAQIPFRASTFGALRMVNCKDPAGNGWELRG